MKRIGLLFMVLLLSSVFMVPQAEAREPTEITDIIEDGDIQFPDPAYIRDSAGNDIYTYFNTKYRGYVEWNISGIPAAAIIDKVEYHYRRYGLAGGDIDAYEMAAQPSVSTDDAVYADAKDGDLYLNFGASDVSDNYYTVDLGAAAVVDVQTAVTGSLGWFALGFYAAPNAVQIYSDESGYGSELHVSWHLTTDLEYMFTDTFFENGTATTPIEITVTGPGFSETFNTSGGTTQYYPVEPETFYWDIGGGDSRYIYSAGSENITVTVPDGTDYAYSFTIKDYTAKTPEFLEAYRIINGTETLVTRKVINQPNTVDLNLVFGKTYILKILFTDGTRYNWGTFVPGSDTTITLNLRSVSFTDSMQLIFNTIQVEATRSTDGSTITIDYNDTRESTVWANVTISVRGGAEIWNNSYSNDTFTTNWASANASLGYIVAIAGEHSDYGEWGYVKIFDVDPTFPAAPSFTGIFDLGLGADFGAWIIVTASIIGFSKAVQGKALIVGALMATLLAYIGWASWDYNQLIFYWLFAILANIAIGRAE